MITVLQIILGKIPYYLGPCMDSVLAWIKVNGYNRVLLRDVDNPFNQNSGFDWLRQCSDYMRLDYLSNHPRVLYIDWDMFIKDIVIEDFTRPCFAQPAIAAGLIYNGDDLSFFNELKQGIEPKQGQHFPIMHRLRDHINNKLVEKQMFGGSFAHLDNCVIRKQSYDI